MVKNTEIRWLVDESADIYRHGPEFGDVERLPYVFPPGLGQGWMEAVYMGQGMTMCKGVHYLIFTPEARGQWIPLAEFAINYHEPTLDVCSCPNGRMRYREFNPAAELSFGGEVNAVRYTTRVHTLPLMDGSCSHEIFGFSIGYSVMVKLLGEDIAAALINGLELQRVPSVRFVSIPGPVSLALHGQWDRELKKL